jgi:hypothetical protein
MPVMNSIEFYQKAIEIEPENTSRFLFCSGEISPGIETHFRRHDLISLVETIKIQQLKQALQNVIGKTL